MVPKPWDRACSSAQKPRQFVMIAQPNRGIALAFSHGRRAVATVATIRGEE
jgi:hypothetical protein